MSDDEYVEMVRTILLGDPLNGLPREPSQLLNHVYIGSQSNAESLRLLQQLGITHVLNCAGFKGPRTVYGSPYEGLGIDYYEFQAEDTDRYDMLRHFPEAFSYLDLVKRRGGVALVHCALGINRSGAVCLGYLMHDARMNLLQATRLLKNKRRIVLANKAFQRQLVRFARSRGFLDKIEKSNGESSFPANNHYHPRSKISSSTSRSDLSPYSSDFDRDYESVLRHSKQLSLNPASSTTSSSMTFVDPTRSSRMARRDQFYAEVSAPRLTTRSSIDLSRDIHESIDRMTEKLKTPSGYRSSSSRVRTRSQSASRYPSTASNGSAAGYYTRRR